MMAVIALDGVPGPTVRVVSTDAVQALPSFVKDGRPPISVLITAETYDVRFCLGGVSPNPGAEGHILASGGSVKLSGLLAVSTFSFCNSTAGSAGVLQITPFYMG